MTPARVAALEACAEALGKLVVYRAALAKPIDPDFREAIERAKEKTWAAATAAIERLEGLGDDMDEIDKRDDPNERADLPLCPGCGGNGMDPMNDYLLPCPHCEGSGYD